MKRKLLILTACFLMIFGSVLYNPKPVKATGGISTIWDVVKDPKKMMIILATASVSISAAASSTFNDNMEAIYNALPTAAKTAIKVMDVSGDNYYLPKTDYQQIVYDLYVTLGLKNLIEGQTGYLQAGSFNPDLTPDKVYSSTNSSVTNVNDANRTGSYYFTTFTHLGISYNFLNSSYVYKSTTTQAISLATVNLSRKLDTGGLYVSTSVSAYPSTLNAKLFNVTYPDETILVQAYRINPSDYIGLPANSDSIYISGNTLYFRGPYSGLQYLKVVNVQSQFVNPFANDTSITMRTPVPPNSLDPSKTWNNVVPGDIDIYPDNVLNNDVYFGGANTDVIDLTPDIINNPVIMPPNIITNPILDVLIHLPAYLEATGDALNDFATSLVDSASGALGTTLGAIGGWLGNLINGVQLGLAAILAYLGSMLSDLIGAMGAQVEKIMDGIREFFGDFLDFIRDFINALKTIIDFFGRLFQFLWTNFIRFLMLLYNTLFLGVFTMLSQFILGLKSLMAVLPTPLDDISYLMIDITVFLTMLSVIIKFLTNSKGKS